jgi:hypothetical protein
MKAIGFVRNFSRRKRDTSCLTCYTLFSPFSSALLLSRLSCWFYPRSTAASAILSRGRELDNNKEGLFSYAIRVKEKKRGSLQRIFRGLNVPLTRRRRVNEHDKRPRRESEDNPIFTRETSFDIFLMMPLKRKHTRDCKKKHKKPNKEDANNTTSIFSLQDVNTWDDSRTHFQTMNHFTLSRMKQWR